MRAETLAEYFENDADGSVSDSEVAYMLRKQHEAIVKLRNAAKAIIDYGNSREASISDWPEWDAKYDALDQALKDTEEIAK